MNVVLKLLVKQSVSLFSLDEISNELNELHEDAKNYDMDDSVLTVIQEV